MGRFARAAVAFVALELIVVVFDAVGGGTHLFLIAAQPLVLLAVATYVE